MAPIQYYAGCYFRLTISLSALIVGASYHLMSGSDIQFALESFVLNNSLSFGVITAVAYDYILTFPREIEYIWCRPWTWVSTIFVVVRYIGLCWIMTNALFGSSLVPGPLEVSLVIDLVSGWTYVVFLSAADLVMILRVYAMWNRRKIILYILLFIYVLQTITAIVFDGIYNNPNTYLSVTVGQILDFSFCIVSYTNTSTLQVYRVIPRLVLSAALVIFAVSQTLIQSIGMYKATKQWQPNRYMQKLVGDGILYFIVNALYQIDYVLIPVAAPTNNTAFFLSTFLYITFYTLIPRFIISIRELYDCDINGRSHIDTGFGVQSQLNPGPQNTVSAIVFVDGNQGPEEGRTDNSSDVETGRLYGSGLNEEPPIEGM